MANKNKKLQVIARSGPSTLPVSLIPTGLADRSSAPWDTVRANFGVSVCLLDAANKDLDALRAHKGVRT